MVYGVLGGFIRFIGFVDLYLCWAWRFIGFKACGVWFGGGIVLKVHRV